MRLNMRFGQLLLYAMSASKSEASKPFPLSLTLCTN